MAKSKKIVGFIGLGVMGRPMARRLLAHGYELVVLDVNPRAMSALTRRGARAARSPREVADEAAVVFVSLPTPQIVRDVALGAEGLVRGRAVRVVVDLSTTGTKVEREVAAGLAARRIQTVDAPVSGGEPRAINGTLAVLAAGKPAAVASVRALLKVFGEIFVVGNRAGQGQLMKLLNNLLSATAFAVTSEAMVAGVKGGLDPDMMIAALNAGTARNSSTVDKFPRLVLTRRFAFGHPIAGVCKDIGLAVDECQSLGVPMWVGSAVRQLWQYAYARGGARKDMTELVTYVEDWAGVKVRGKAKARVKARGKR